MSLEMQREVVRPRECFAAQAALEGPVVGVLARVARQLVRARELPAAVVPPANVRLLARVCAQVRLVGRKHSWSSSSERANCRPQSCCPQINQ